MATCESLCNTDDKCKTVSWDGYQWGHFGSIIFHILVSFFVIYTGVLIQNARISNKNVLVFNNPISISYLGKILKWIGVVFAIVSLLSLWPIFTTKYDKYYIR